MDYLTWVERDSFSCSCMLCASVWAVCSPSQAQVLLHFGSAVWTLSRISNLHIYCPHRADDPLSVHSTPSPKGSLIGVVDHTCQLHLHVQVCINFPLLLPLRLLMSTIMCKFTTMHTAVRLQIQV